MFKFKRKKDTTLLLVEQAIEKCAEQLLELDSDSEEYAKINTQFMELINLKNRIEPSQHISPETWVTIIANLAGILLILNYERTHALATKAIGFVSKPRI